MDIPHLATILSSTFDPNLREEAEKKLNEVRVSNLNCSFRKSFFFLTHACRPIFAKDLISLLQLKKAYDLEDECKAGPYANPIFRSRK